MRHVIAPYAHDSSNLEPIWLAVTKSKNEQPTVWVDAFRDTVNGKRVVRAKFDIEPPFVVWVKDSKGIRQTAVL